MFRSRCPFKRKLIEMKASKNIIFDNRENRQTVVRKNAT